MRSILLISLVFALAATYVSANTGATLPADQQTTAGAPPATDGGATEGGAATTAAAQPPAGTTGASNGFKKEVASLTTFALAALLGRLLI
jgi:hypothetical protein